MFYTHTHIHVWNRIQRRKITKFIDTIKVEFCPTDDDKYKTTKNQFDVGFYLVCDSLLFLKT